MQPVRASVKPRTISHETGDVILLEDAVASWLEMRDRGIIQIIGGCGSGRTSALRHLADVLSDQPNICFLDDVDFRQVSLKARESIVVWGRISTQATQLHSQTATGAISSATFSLIPWGDDDLIEYLVTTHPEKCQSVMSRLVKSSQRKLLSGIPELCRCVLDRMAQDESLVDERAALWRTIDSLLETPASWELAHEAALILQVDPKDSVEEVVRKIDCPQFVRLLRHRVVRLLVAADGILHALTSGGDVWFLVACLPEALICEVASGVTPQITSQLQLILQDRNSECHAMAASILHKSSGNWIPERPTGPNWDESWILKLRPLPDMAWAYLQDANWRGLDLRKASLVGTNLSRANLTDAILNYADAHQACLRGATLKSASLNAIQFIGADLSGADLSAANAFVADFRDAQLNSANLEGAILERARFEETDLTDARLMQTDLRSSRLTNAIIDGADFSQANLSCADLHGLDLRTALFAGANFMEANLCQCNLEDMELPTAKFASTNLSRAMLTGSRMRQGIFRNADLAEAGLAQIDWEGADLRGADLTRCTFHLGSSRSGLVNSTIASEGTRTGFYSDDFDEQYFKTPEEIRKANLRHADLRGACVDGVDFYLVDLRGAQYSAAQHSHFQRCGAILDDWKQ